MRNTIAVHENEWGEDKWFVYAGHIPEPIRWRIFGDGMPTFHFGDETEHEYYEFDMIHEWLAYRQDDNSLSGFSACIDKYKEWIDGGMMQEVVA